MLKWVALAAIGVLLTAVGALLLALGEGAGVTAQEAQTCEVLDDPTTDEVEGISTEEVLDGVTLTWTSAFLCADAALEGEYEFTVSVTNHSDSVEAVVIEEMVLGHTTPRPGGQAPDAGQPTATLPITVEPGETKTFKVMGDYQLVETDEGKKANLHFHAQGVGADSGDSFNLGINCHLRAEGVAL